MDSRKTNIKIESILIQKKQVKTIPNINSETEPYSKNSQNKNKIILKQIFTFLFSARAKSRPKNHRKIRQYKNKSFSETWFEPKSETFFET
jgi:hypothetical protein